MTTKTKEEQLQDIGKSAMASIREMVAALECDYDRLEELREQKTDWEPTPADGWDSADPAAYDGPATWEEAYPDEAEELKDLEGQAGDCTSQDDARERIMEDPLSLQFRSGWVSSKEDMEPEEYELLLTTGGPAVRIVGEVHNGEAHSARLEVQDWFTPWTEYITTHKDHDALLTYARCFCFES